MSKIKKLIKIDAELWDEFKQQDLFLSRTIEKLLRSYLDDPERFRKEWIPVVKQSH